MALEMSFPRLFELQAIRRVLPMRDDAIES